MTTRTDPQPHSPTLFQNLESYPYSTDPEFQSGLTAILGPSPSPSQADHLTLRARCFYYARKHNTPVDFNAYLEWRARNAVVSPPLVNGSSSRSEAPVTSSVGAHTPSALPPTPQEQSNSTASPEPAAPYPTSFSQIVELITNGQPIPGIKEVPDTILEGQASQQTSTRRKKPWEKDDAAGGEQNLAAIDAA